MFASLAAHRTVEWSLVESNTLCTVEVFLTRDWASKTCVTQCSTETYVTAAPPTLTHPMV